MLAFVINLNVLQTFIPFFLKYNKHTTLITICFVRISQIFQFFSILRSSFTPPSLEFYHQKVISITSSFMHNQIRNNSFFNAIAIFNEFLVVNVSIVFHVNCDIIVKWTKLLKIMTKSKCNCTLCNMFLNSFLVLENDRNESNPYPYRIIYVTPLL